MHKPLLHTNGTSRDALRADYDTARESLRRAVLAVQDCAPNARDYYPHDYRAAVDEHNARMASLELVNHEIYALLEHVVDAP